MRQLEKGASVDYKTKTMSVMSLIREVFHKQHASLMSRPIEHKKLILSSLVYDDLVGEMEFYSGEKIDKSLACKILGLDVEVIDSNDIFISITLK